MLSTCCAIPNAQSHILKNFMDVSLEKRRILKLKYVAVTYAFII